MHSSVFENMSDHKWFADAITYKLELICRWSILVLNRNGVSETNATGMLNSVAADKNTKYNKGKWDPILERSGDEQRSLICNAHITNMRYKHKHGSPKDVFVLITIRRLDEIYLGLYNTTSYAHNYVYEGVFVIAVCAIVHSFTHACVCTTCECSRHW